MSLLHQIMLDSPVGYWPMNEASGTSMADESGNTRNGTLVGGATPGVAGPAGLSVDLDGTNDQMTASMSTSLDLAALTAECWINTDVVGAGGVVLVASRSESNGTTVRFSCSVPTAQDRMEAWNGSVAVDSGASSLSPVGVWTHLAWCWGSGVVDMYANGVLLASPTLAMGSATSQVFRVGGMTTGSGNNYFLNGKIAQVAVFGSRLTAARIAAHYYAGQLRLSSYASVSY